ncbi:MAG: phosphoribosylanthranilate isomerase [Calditrichae bacterium]|nr:phosphoribosylanthranilate isomerase [Calditrichota bacterium]MCB9057193.1 phosphoribosylanthranilate isomerase [Calditrichia bacterium]
MIRIKICGITNLDDAVAAQNLGADAVGFIFYQKSKRYISPENAKYIINSLNPFIAKVGVFVNESKENVGHIAKSVGLTHVQLHGNESVKYARSLLMPVIRAFNFSELKHVRLDDWQDFSVLIDSGSSSNPGGTGQTFPWQELVKEIQNTPFILAGGLNPENVLDAIKIAKPIAVDVSSGVELEYGKKSIEKIKQFIDKVKLSESI